MHVLQVAWEHPPRLYGGLGRHVEGLAAALVGAGAAVTVLTPGGGFDGPEPGWPAGLRLLRAAPPRTALPAEQWVAEVLDANARMVERLLADTAAAGAGAGPVVDVLHVHDWMAGHAARLLAPVLGVPVVATVHATERGRHQGHLPPGVSAWIDAQERALVALADRVVVCAEHMRDHVVAHLGADPSRTSVIPNGVDPSRWQAPAGSRPDAPGAARPRVVVAGRLEHEKGIHVLLEAAVGTGWEVVVAGDGTKASELRASELRAISQRTGSQRAPDRRAGQTTARFVGRLDQPALAALLATADVVVVPSLYEPFGLAALEAMAVGVPVVASRTGGLVEVVTDGAGLLVDPDDPAALRTAVQRVLDSPALAARLAAGGRRRAARLSWPASARAHLALYEGLRASG